MVINENFNPEITLRKKSKLLSCKNSYSKSVISYHWWQLGVTEVCLLPFITGVNTGGVGSYIYDKEPSTETQP